MNNSDLFDVDFFLKYFEAIPENRWCRGTYDNEHGKHCALGHLGCRVDITGIVFYGAMGDALHVLLFSHFGIGVTVINDFVGGALPAVHHFDQPTPRARILAALREIKSKQLPTPPALVLTPAWPTVAMQVPVEKVGV